MGELDAWLTENKPKRKSKFINQWLKVGEEFIGIYEAVRKTSNNYGRTVHYIFYGEDYEQIFDNHNPKIAAIFVCIPFQSRVSIKKVLKDGIPQFEVKLLNTLEDEKISP
jgi:hypothetical protein